MCAQSMTGSQANHTNMDYDNSGMKGSVLLKLVYLRHVNESFMYLPHLQSSSGQVLYFRIEIRMLNSYQRNRWPENQPTCTILATTIDRFDKFSNDKFENSQNLNSGLTIDG